MFKIEIESKLEKADLAERFHDGGKFLKRTYSTEAAARGEFDLQYKGDLTVTARVIPE